METLKYCAAFVGIVIGIDFLGFFAWAMSGQAPVDGMFVGAITRHILGLFF